MTTRELTPEQTATALDLLQVTTRPDVWLRYDHEYKEFVCFHCQSRSKTGWHRIDYSKKCPVTAAAALLAAVDGAQEAGE